ncbi:MAG TPA: replicative DNA helicase [Firmicutes bacterium]|nr:replicative DNA helicase [Bacillota bacterium]
MDEQEVLGMPQSDFAERAILGSILLEPNSIYAIAAILRPDDFYKDAHKKIFETLIRLNEQGGDIDTFLLANALREQGLLEPVGGVGYLTELYESVPSAANVKSYVDIVKDKSTKRSLIALTERLTREARGEDSEAASLLEEAESEIYYLTQNTQPSSLDHIAPYVSEAFDNLGKNEQGVPTFLELDRILGGLHRTDMIIVAARPGMGKTTFCINLAERAATQHGCSVAFFSLEMSNVQLASRMLVSRARVNAEHLKKAETITDRDMVKLTQAMEDISKAKIFLDDTPGITVAEIRGKVRRLKKEKGLDLIVIDYIGLMQASTLMRQENRQQQISEVSRQLKGLAKELDVPIIVISQLNRASVKGDNTMNTKEPDLSHLRESGALEQDADVVLFIHRPSYYNPELEDKELAKIKVAKHRNGAIGEVEMTFISECTLFMGRDKKHVDENVEVSPEELAGYVEPPQE